jgi:predicted nucleotidyltransferase
MAACSDLPKGQRALNDSLLIWYRLPVARELIDRCALIELLRAYGGALRENGATGLFIFGSRAVAQERPDSDLDLFIDYDRQAKIPNIFRLMRIEETISQALGIPVTTPCAMRFIR